MTTIPNFAAPAADQPHPPLRCQMDDLPAGYRTALQAACAAALDAGLFYEQPFALFVLEHLGTADAARDCFVGIHVEPDGFAERRALRNLLEARIGGSPRGTWALLHRPDPGAGRDFYTAIMSDGTGRPAPGCRYDTYETPPTYAEVHRRVTDHEEYKARQHVEGSRRRARNLEIIATRGFAVGRTYRTLVIAGGAYSTVTITGLHPAPEPHTTIIGADDRGWGWLTLALVKRGSPKRYQADMPASQLARALDVAAAAAPLAPVPLLHA